jgi:hypothetical protein
MTDQQRHRQFRVIFGLGWLAGVLSVVAGIVLGAWLN